MRQTTEHGSTRLAHIALAILAAAGAILATPLGAAPSVLLALIATILMLIIGRGTLRKLGQRTVQARNILLIAFGGWFLAELLSTAINNQHWTNLDYPLRFMLGIGVFWIIRYAAIRRIDIFYFAVMASAIAAVTISASQFFIQGIERPMGWTNHPIYFGNMSALFCVYAVIALATLRDKLTVQMRFFFAVTILFLTFAAFLSMSRSSWLGLAGLLVLVDWNRVNYNRLIGGGLVIATGLVLMLMLIPELAPSLRITNAIEDVHGILNGDYRSSIGDRLQMWKAAFLMFWSSPLIGIGSGHYQAEVVNLAASGAVDLELFQGTTVFNQPHSDIMDALATKGLIGLVAYLVLLILPFRFFSGLAETPIAEVKAFALMGQATVIAFLMFGLTNATFKVQIYCAVYPLMIAIFAAIALNLSEANREAEHE